MRDNTILVVVDPTAGSHQPALERAAWLAKQAGARLELFASEYDPDLDSARAAAAAPAARERRPRGPTPRARGSGGAATQAGAHGQRRRRLGPSVRRRDREESRGARLLARREGHASSQSGAADAAHQCRLAFDSEVPRAVAARQGPQAGGGAERARRRRSRQRARQAGGARRSHFHVCGGSRSRVARPSARRAFVCDAARCGAAARRAEDHHAGAPRGDDEVSRYARDAGRPQAPLRGGRARVLAASGQGARRPISSSWAPSRGAGFSAS